MSEPMPAPRRSPQVLCLSGLDPSGGAGLQADIEAISAQGAHALGVLTANTVQNTRDVQRVVAVAPALIAEQCAALEEDCPIAAIKIGLIGAAEQVPLIAELIGRLGVPVVLDPVLRAGGGASLAGAAVHAALLETLVPLATMLTPNAAEARRLAGSDNLDTCGARLLARGAAQVLITGGDEDEAEAVNRWYAPDAAVRPYAWPRLPGGFHGAGCTLAAALAARLALGEPIATALETAQAYVHETLARALHIGQGRPIPNRVRSA